MRLLKRALRLNSGDRGNVLTIVVSTVTILFIFSGVAIDMGHIIAVKHQLKTAMDAGALAGAAQLSLAVDDPVTARSTAASFASKNYFAGGYPSLSTAGDNSGNVKTGIWNGTTWTPTSTAPTGQVLNGVRCQWSAPVSTSFLGLIGFPTINVTGSSTAAFGSPATPCAGCAVMPIGLPGCAFQYGQSQGCGYLVYSDLAGGNTVWTNLNGSNANNNDIGNQIAAAYNGQPVDSSWSLNAGTFLQTTNGDVGYGNMFNDLGKVTGCGSQPSCGQFVTKYNQSASNPYTVETADGTVVYQGQGWEVVVPILDMSATNCEQTGSGNLKILTWTYFVIVQFINGGKCTVNNPGYNGEAPWKSRCDNAALGGTASTAPNKNILYGYYNCRHMNSPSTAQPAPMASFSKPKIVQ